MQVTIVDWLGRVGSTAFALSAWAFVLLNGLAVLALLRTRDTGLVNRWTSRFLAANLVLLGTGLGIPAATFAARTAIVTLAPAVRVMSQPIQMDERSAESPVRP
jgi:hypothetical protein